MVAILFSLPTLLFDEKLCSHSGWLILKWSAIGLEFISGAETNCGIAHVLGILMKINRWFDFYFSDIIVI